MSAGLARDAVSGAGDADGDRQRHRSVPDGGKARERRARPRRARRFEEGAALRRGLEEALLRRHERGRKLGDGAQRRVVGGGDGAVGVHEEHRVAETAAFAEHHREPAPQRLGILDVAGLDRPLDAARIGKGADRIGRRQPGHEAIERGDSALIAAKAGTSGFSRLGPRFRGDERTIFSIRCLAMIVVMVMAAMLVTMAVVVVSAVLRIERRFAPA